MELNVFDQLAAEHQEVVRDMVGAARAVLMLNDIAPRNDDHAGRFQEACAMYLARSFVAMRRDFVTDAPPARSTPDQVPIDMTTFSGFATSEPAPPAPVVPADPEPAIKAGGGGDYAGGGASDSWSTASSSSSSSDSGGSSGGDSGGSSGGGGGD